MSNSKFKLIVFDLDGTLVDSAPDIAFAVDSMLAELGMAPRGVEQVRHFLGNGVEWLAKRALTGELWAEPEPELLQKAKTRLLYHYGQINGERTKLYPGVTEVLAYAQHLSIQLACLTNKNRQFTEPLLAAMNLQQQFQFISCGDDSLERKPDPAPLQRIMQQAGVDSFAALMVGDSITDVKTARNAGTAVVGVSYGYNHGEPISDAEPDWVIDSMLEIRAILDQSEPLLRQV